MALENSFKLSWQAQNDPRLNGYALYKFEANRFLRHEPYAVLDKTVLTFTDTTPLRKHTRPCYAIRPSYLVNGIVTYGALSNVVCYQEK